MKISPKSEIIFWSMRYWVLALFIWFLLFAFGIVGYSGTKTTYALFSIVMGIMLLTGLRQTNNYGYFFLTVFIWLGFWLKLTVHTIFDYPFVEGVGMFVGVAEAWDQVLSTGTVASLGVILGKIIFNLVKCRGDSSSREIKSVVPHWYEKSRKWLWGGLLVVFVAVLIVNLKYSIHLIGMAPRTVLIWPLNAVVAWLLNIGLATSVAVFLWWEIILKKNISVTVYAIIVEALFSSVSILSRAAYVFHVMPQLWVVSRFRHATPGWSRAKVGFLAVIFAFFFVISISAVTAFRSYLYQSGAYLSTASSLAESRSAVVLNELYELTIKIENGPSAERLLLVARSRELMAEKLKLERTIVEEKAKLVEYMKSGAPQSRVLLNEFGYQIKGGFLPVLLQLCVDRWIGLEGMMAVQAYPDRNMDLFWHGLSEKPEAGKPDIYQTIANSIYLKSDGEKYRFATLPGAVAFLYYSNSLPFVMLGMAFFSFGILIVEYLISFLTGNPIICSLYGVLMASNVTQFGASPRQSLPYFFMLACGVFLIWFIRTSFFELMLNNLKIYKTVTSRDQ